MTAEANQGQPVASDTNVEPTTPAEPTKTAEQLLEEQKELLHNAFPVGSTVQLTATDVKNNYAKVLSHVEKRNVLCVQVELTHYASGKPREENKRTKMDVRQTSLQKAEVPTPAPEAPKAEPATETNSPA